jgi:primosomal protein N''
MKQEKNVHRGPVSQSRAEALARVAFLARRLVAHEAALIDELHNLGVSDEEIEAATSGRQPLRVPALRAQQDRTKARRLALVAAFSRNRVEPARDDAGRFVRTATP